MEDYFEYSDVVKSLKNRAKLVKFQCGLQQNVAYKSGKRSDYDLARIMLKEWLSTESLIERLETFKNSP